MKLLREYYKRVKIQFCLVQLKQFTSYPYNLNPKLLKECNCLNFKMIINSKQKNILQNQHHLPWHFSVYKQNSLINKRFEVDKVKYKNVVNSNFLCFNLVFCFHLKSIYFSRPQTHRAHKVRSLCLRYQDHDHGQAVR